MAARGLRKIGDIDSSNWGQVTKLSPKQYREQWRTEIIPFIKGDIILEEVTMAGTQLPGVAEWRLKPIKLAWQETVKVEERQPDDVWKALWRTVLPLNTQEFLYKLLHQKLVVRTRIGLWN